MKESYQVLIRIRSLLFYVPPFLRSRTPCLLLQVPRGPCAHVKRVRFHSLIAIHYLLPRLQSRPRLPCALHIIKMSNLTTLSSTTTNFSLTTYASVIYSSSASEIFCRTPVLIRYPSTTQPCQVSIINATNYYLNTSLDPSLSILRLGQSPLLVGPPSANTTDSGDDGWELNINFDDVQPGTNVSIWVRFENGDGTVESSFTPSRLVLPGVVPPCSFM